MIPQFHFCLYTPKNWEQDLKKYLDIHIHSSTLYNCQRAEATQVSTEGRVDKKMWYTRTMEWYSALKGRKFCSTMDEPWGHDVIWKEASLNKTRRFHLYELPRAVQFIETESRMVVARVGIGGGGNGEMVIIGYRVSVLQDERSSGNWCQYA